jgi:hypothetical protein
LHLIMVDAFRKTVAAWCFGVAAQLYVRPRKHGMFTSNRFHQGST